MLSRRTALDLLISCAVVTVADAAPAQKKDAAPGQKKHNHNNGHNLLGAKLRQNGRHEVHKTGQMTVSADVNNGKVTGMAANHAQKGNLPARKVKSTRKLAELEPQRVRVAANDDTIKLAQVYYYAWCFDDGLEEHCYWYSADVVIVDSSWVEYVV